jgi:hypothetical protein
MHRARIPLPRDGPPSSRRDRLSPRGQRSWSPPFRPIQGHALRQGEGYSGDLRGGGGGVCRDGDGAVAISSMVRARPRSRAGAPRGGRRQGVHNSDGGASDLVVGASRSAQLTWWWIMSRSPPRSRREMPSVAEPRRRRRRCATLWLLRGRRVSTNHPAWPRQSGQPSPRGPRPSCGWGTTPTSGATHASPRWIGRIRSALSSCWMTSQSRATWTGCKRGSKTFLVP